jgi:hypothetical protein
LIERIENGGGAGFKTNQRNCTSNCCNFGSL